MTPCVVGLDLSLTSTGVATVTATMTATERVTPPRGCTGTARLRHIRDAVTNRVAGVRPDLVTVEGYSYGSRVTHAHSLGELGGVIRLALTETGVHWVAIPPATLKRYATGRGNADKHEMVAAAIRRLRYDGSSPDEADALWLAHAGHHLLGHGLVDLPKTHLAALAGIDLTKGE